MAEDMIDKDMFISHRPMLANLDVLDLVKLIDMHLIQCAACNSASQTVSHLEDLITIRAGWEHLTERFEQHVAAPHLWLPNYAPTPLDVSGPPSLKRVENPLLQSNMNLLAALRTQLINSNTADRVAGFEAREVETVIRPLLEKGLMYVKKGIDDLENPTHNYLPDVNLQEPGVNPGNPQMIRK